MGRERKDMEMVSVYTDKSFERFDCEEEQEDSNWEKAWDQDQKGRLVERKGARKWGEYTREKGQQGEGHKGWDLT